MLLSQIFFILVVISIVLAAGLWYVISSLRKLISWRRNHHPPKSFYLKYLLIPLAVILAANSWTIRRTLDMGPVPEDQLRVITVKISQVEERKRWRAYGRFGGGFQSRYYLHLEGYTGSLAVPATASFQPEEFWAVAKEQPVTLSYDKGQIYSIQLGDGAWYLSYEDSCQGKMGSIMGDLTLWLGLLLWMTGQALKLPVRLYREDPEQCKQERRRSRKAMVWSGVLTMALVLCGLFQRPKVTVTPSPADPAAARPAGQAAADTQAPPYPAPEGWWWYGDLLVRRCGEVYGYGTLTPAGQQLFDLLYGDYFSEQVRTGQEKFRKFTLAQPVSKEEYRAAVALYEAATSFESFPNVSYRTDDGKMVQTVYCEGGNWGLEGVSEFHRLSQERADEICAEMPEHLSDYETCQWICRRLSEQGAKCTWEEGDPGLHASAHATAYGAICARSASDKGMSRAFQLLASRTDLNFLPVNSDASFLNLLPVSDSGAFFTPVWTMVELDGAWYDLTFQWKGDMPVWTLCNDYTAQAVQPAFGDTGVPLPQTDGVTWLGRVE